MAVSKFAQRLIFADTLLEYVSVGGNCESCGIMGFLGHSLGGVEGAAQAVSASASSPNITSKTSVSLTLSRKCFINAALSGSLEFVGFDVRGGCGCFPFVEDMLFPGSVNVQKQAHGSSPLV